MPKPEPEPKERAPASRVRSKLRSLSELKDWIIENGYARGSKDPLIRRINEVFAAYQKAADDSKRQAIEVIMEGIGLERKRLDAMRVYYYEMVAKASATDEKTGLLNLGWFQLRLTEHLLKSRESEVCCAVSVSDIAGFKRINDSLGHQVGDRVIVEIANILKHCLRSDDPIARERRTEQRKPSEGSGLPGRLGGDEFCFLLPETGTSEAFQAAERFRQAVEAYSWPSIHPQLSVLVSVGLVSLVGFVDHRYVQALVEDIISNADRLMYQSKKEGSRTVAVGRFVIEKGRLIPE